MSNILDRIVAEMENQLVLVEHKKDYMILPHINSLPRTLVFRYRTNLAEEFIWYKDLLLYTKEEEFLERVWKLSPNDIKAWIRAWFLASGYKLGKIIELTYIIEAATDGLEVDLRKLNINGIAGLILDETLPISSVLNIASILLADMQTYTHQRLAKFERLGWTWEANTVADMYDQKEVEFQGNSTDKDGRNPKYKARPHNRMMNPEPEIDYDSPEYDHVKDVLNFLQNPEGSEKKFKFAKGQQTEVITKKEQ